MQLNNHEIHNLTLVHTCALSLGGRVRMCGEHGVLFMNALMQRCSCPVAVGLAAAQLCRWLSCADGWARE